MRETTLQQLPRICFQVYMFTIGSPEEIGEKAEHEMKLRKQDMGCFIWTFMPHANIPPHPSYIKSCLMRLYGHGHDIWTHQNGLQNYGTS